MMFAVDRVDIYSKHPNLFKWQTKRVLPFSVNSAASAQTLFFRLFVGTRKLRGESANFPQPPPPPPLKNSDRALCRISISLNFIGTKNLEFRIQNSWRKEWKSFNIYRYRRGHSKTM